MRKKIGIVGQVSADGKLFGIGVAYLMYFSQFGEVVTLNHMETEARTDLDLVVLPGGPDVDYNRYLDFEAGDQLSLHTGRPCNVRERFDRVLLPKYIAQGTAIFGICRGHQSLAVHFGAKLVQHMSHEANTGDNRKKLVHDVNVRVSALNAMGLVYRKPALQGKKKFSAPVTNYTIKTNSIHHQVVASVPKNGQLLATHGVGLDGTIEAIVYPNHNAASVQWHPEEIEDQLSTAIITNLLKL